MIVFVCVGRVGINRASVLLLPGFVRSKQRSTARTTLLQRDPSRPHRRNASNVAKRCGRNGPPPARFGSRSLLLAAIATKCFVRTVSRPRRPTIEIDGPVSVETQLDTPLRFLDFLGSFVFGRADAAAFLPLHSCCVDDSGSP